MTTNGDSAAVLLVSDGHCDRGFLGRSLTSRTLLDEQTSRGSDLKQSRWGHGRHHEAAYPYTVTEITPPQAASGDGELARSARFSIPQRTLQLTLQDVGVGDTLNKPGSAVAKLGGYQWGQYVTANDMYTINGNSDGAMGYSCGSGLDKPGRIQWTPLGTHLRRRYRRCVVCELSSGRRHQHR